jgi:3-deoxy-D-manno-octulosonic acid (KDO) 8-phosphate synthase
MKESCECDGVLVDITHLQNHSAIYDRFYAEQVGMAAIAAGADGLFMEVTKNPYGAKCDADAMLPGIYFAHYLEKFIKLYRFVNDNF